SLRRTSRMRCTNGQMHSSKREEERSASNCLQDATGSHPEIIRRSLVCKCEQGNCSRRDAVEGKWCKRFCFKICYQKAHGYVRCNSCAHSAEQRLSQESTMEERWDFQK